MLSPYLVWRNVVTVNPAEPNSTTEVGHSHDAVTASDRRS
jgi:hypothetical protein